MNGEKKPQFLHFTVTLNGNPATGGNGPHGVLSVVPSGRTLLNCYRRCLDYRGGTNLCGKPPGSR